MMRRVSFRPDPELPGAERVLLEGTSSRPPVRVGALSFQLPELSPPPAPPLAVPYVCTPDGAGRVLEASRRRALVRVGDLPGKRLPPADAERWFPLRTLTPWRAAP